MANPMKLQVGRRPGDETTAPLLIVAALLALDVASSRATAPPGHNHLEPMDSAVVTLTMLLIAAIAYARPVEYGAQMLDGQHLLAGLSWLITILGAPFLLLILMPVARPQLGLVAMLVSAILANIITQTIAPAEPPATPP